MEQDRSCRDFYKLAKFLFCDFIGKVCVTVFYYFSDLAHPKLLQNSDRGNILRKNCSCNAEKMKLINSTMNVASSALCGRRTNC